MVWLGCAAQGGGAAWAGVRGVRDIRTGEEHGERVLSEVHQWLLSRTSRGAGWNNV